MPPRPAVTRSRSRTTPPDLDGLRTAIQHEVAKVVVGQASVVDRLLGCVLVGGHVLLRGVPGVAKTLVAHSFAQALGLEFRRVQFTPDMLPSDVTGTVVLRGGNLEFRPGPVFANVLLGDEINRTPPKTQSALLEAMQERQVSVDGVTHELPDPFLVIATQNPIEFEGTYPLPEAQLDRFHMLVDVEYPGRDAEIAMLQLAHDGVAPATLDDIVPVTNEGTVRALRQYVAATEASPELVAYVVDIVAATRALPSAEVGASPRAAVHLLAAAKAAARIAGRAYVTPDDVVASAGAVLGHRIQLSAEAELDDYSPLAAVDASISAVAVPR